MARSYWTPEIGRMLAEAQKKDGIQYIPVQTSVKNYGDDVRKYAIEHNGKEYLLSSVTHILGDTIPKGDSLINWAVQQTLIDMLASLVPGNRLPAEHIETIKGLNAMIERVIGERGGKKDWTFFELIGKVAVNNPEPDGFHYSDWQAVANTFDRAMVARRRSLEEAGEIGTRAHELIETWSENGGTLDKYDIEGNFVPFKMEDEDPRVQNAFKAFMAFWDAHEFEHIHQEIPLYNVSLGYAGTGDAIPRDKDGKLVLLDWKTSSGVYISHQLQCAAYAHAFETMAISEGEQIDRAYVVRIDKKTAACEVVPAWENRGDFLELLHQWGRCCQADYALKQLTNKLDRYKRKIKRGELG